MAIRNFVHLTVWIPASDWGDADVGASCVYVRGFQGLMCGMNWGVKSYRLKSHCLRAASRQRVAANKGLAPAVGPRVRVQVEGHGRIRFGYLTEHAFDVGTKKADDAVTHVRAALNAAGLGTRDLRACNVGQLADGRWVRIDFDDLSS